MRPCKMGLLLLPASRSMHSVLNRAMQNVKYIFEGKRNGTKGKEEKEIEFAMCVSDLIKDPHHQMVFI